MATRPLSPHATIYRYAHTMLLSFAHRATGVALAVGFLLLSYWLMALAAGPEEYRSALALLGSGVGKILLAAWLLAFVYHLCNGIRHLVWDTGKGLEKAQARRSAAVVVVAALVLFGYVAWRAFASAGAVP